MDIVIFGANGQTGRLLTEQALAAGHRVVAATRRPGDFPLSDAKLTVAAVDVRDAAAVTEVVAGADAVLSRWGFPSRASLSTPIRSAREISSPRCKPRACGGSRW